MSARTEIADFWDEVLRTWAPGELPTHGDLAEWFAGYAGRGAGAVDLSAYPDPYVGDLRGETHDVRVVVLGLNPGIGYPELQGPDGIWTRRIQQTAYSRCFERSPAEDPVSWTALHGKPSTYWRNLISFTRRWVDDDSATVTSVLNLELYPWHSTRLTGTLAPPRELVRKYVWDAVAEVDTEVVFAFGKPWVDTCASLGLDEVTRWGPDAEQVPGVGAPGWIVVTYRLPSGQVVVASSQPGYAGPPGPKRIDSLRTMVTAAHRG